MNPAMFFSRKTCFDFGYAYGEGVNKTQTYKTIHAETAGKLDDEVNGHLSKGWQLYGDPYCNARRVNFRR